MVEMPNAGVEAVAHDARRGGRKEDLHVETFLRDLGADDAVIETAACGSDRAEVQQLKKRFGSYARANPAIVLSALSALVVGGAAVATAVKSSKVKSRRRTAPAPAAASTKRSSAKKSSSKKTSTKKASSKRSTSSSKRTLIEPHEGDKRFIRRDARGRIKESVDVGRSLAADRRRKAKTRAKSGAGDQGDR